MKQWPKRLHHHVPSWVEPGNLFHIRIRVHPTYTGDLCTEPLGHQLLQSVDFYHGRRTWFVRLFLLMPEHAHALLAFPRDSSMSKTIGDWKRYQDTHHGVGWQDNYFDHRIRNDESLEEKVAYIRMNPVVKGLCAAPEDWPWVIEHPLRG